MKGALLCPIDRHVEVSPGELAHVLPKQLLQSKQPPPRQGCMSSACPPYVGAQLEQPTFIAHTWVFPNATKAARMVAAHVV